jgi:hypothetical protein
MARKLLKINELKRVYIECNNVEKERIVNEAIDSIKALTIIPEVKNE